MKKEYIKPELDIKLFTTEDVLAFGDGSEKLEDDELTPIFNFGGRIF